jgi:hypothetical protein
VLVGSLSQRFQVSLFGVKRRLAGA